MDGIAIGITLASRWENTLPQARGLAGCRRPGTEQADAFPGQEKPYGMSSYIPRATELQLARIRMVRSVLKEVNHFPGNAGGVGMKSRKAVLLRIQPALYEELRAWAKEEVRSVNLQIEYLLQQAVLSRDRSRGSETEPTAPPGARSRWRS
jgi:hypothetical protein